MRRTAVCLGLAAALAGLAPVPASAAEDFCGVPSGDPAAIMDGVMKMPGVKQAFNGPEYVAYSDPATETMFTFTRSGLGPAHPAAVCRKPVRAGDAITLQMVIVCRGAVDACQRLESDFKLLNAKMEAHIRGQTGAAANPGAAAAGR
jgi:hypothetical protein